MKTVTTALATIGTCFLVAGLAFLLWKGVIFGEAPVRYARMGLVALVVLTTYAFGGFLAALRDESLVDAAERWRPPVVAAAAVAGAVWAVTGLVIPGTPADAAATPCAGVPTRGEGYRLVTPPTGVNLRSDPAVTSDQLGRLQSGCTILVEGYCLGDYPLSDATNDTYVDSRWFLLKRFRGEWTEPAADVLSGGSKTDQFVAAANFEGLVSNTIVEQLPAEDCGMLYGQKYRNRVFGPATLMLTGTQPADGSDPGNTLEDLRFQVSARNTFEFGVALLIKGRVTTRSNYRKISNWTRPNEVTLEAIWNTEATGQYLKKPTNVVVFGGRCVAIGAPVPTDRDDLGDDAALTIRLAPDGQARALDKDPRLTQSEVDELTATACREDAP